MAMTFEEMMKKLSDSGATGGSMLHLRSENLQNKKRIVRIPMLKNALKKRRMLVLPVDLALPFNPETGEADDVYNVDNKFRPGMSATTVALALKSKAVENEALKATLMKRAGVESWDLSDATELTKEDWKIFGQYRVPKIYSIAACHINIPAMGTGQYGRDYAISVFRDPKTGEVTGDYPSFMKVNKLFNDRNYEEIKDYEQKIKDKVITATDEQQKEHRSSIRSKTPVSDDRYLNFVQMFEIPLDSKGIIDKDVLSSDFNASEYEVLSRYKKGIRQAMEKYRDTDWTRLDKNFDFFILIMKCPATGDDTTNQGKAKIGLDTTFDAPVVLLDDAEDYDNGAKTAPIVEGIRKFIDDDVDAERRVRNSMNVSVFNEEVEQKMFNSLSTVIDLKGDKFFTQNVIKGNADIIALIFGDEGDELIESVDAGISDKEEGVLDEGASQAEAKEYDLNDDEFQEAASDFDEVDLTAE